MVGVPECAGLIINGFEAIAMVEEKTKSERHKKHLENKNAGHRRHYQRHREEILAKKKAYYQANKARIDANAKKWRTEHPERYRELQRKYKDASKARYNELVDHPPGPEEMSEKMEQYFEYLKGT